MFSGNSSVFVNVAFGVGSIVVENRPVSEITIRLELLEVWLALTALTSIETV